MIKVPRMTDRFNLTFHGEGDDKLVLVVRPLNIYEKSQIDLCYENKDGKKIVNVTKQTFLLVKYMVTEIKGLKDFEGNDYEPEMENNLLSDNAVNELLNTDFAEYIVYAANQMKNHIPEKLFDFSTKKELEGVDLEFSHNTRTVTGEKK